MGKKNVSRRDAEGAKVASGPETPELETAELEVPEFTIRADSAFGIRCMMAIASHAEMMAHEDLPFIRRKLREFDLYEEACRSL